MPTEKNRAFGTCPVCGQAFSASDRLVFGSPQAAQHHECRFEILVNALRRCADTLGCSPKHLLTTRLGEMQRRIIRALGEISVEQFRNSGPQGFIFMRLVSPTGFEVSVEFRPIFIVDAIYHEALITPGSLQQRRAQLLTQISDEAFRQGIPMSQDVKEARMLEQLKSGESHWDGRKKEDLSLQILSAEYVARRALSFVEKDQGLVVLASAETRTRLEQLSQKLIDSLI